ncbi:MAG TPA: response regulator transcription factor [Phycisphaerae bacterium]|nr:response regulator transcription factor [Phycisphaerae bacterium]
MARTVSILIVDDHESIRQLLKDRLSAEPDMTVVSHVDNAEAAVAEAIEHKPDVILMDIDMPGLSAFDAAARITARCPNSRVLFLTAFVKDRYIESALAVQAWGYVTKTEPPEAVIKAIRDVSRGFAYFSREVQSRLVVDSKGVRLAEKGQTLASTLTPREREVLCYLAQGRSKKAIAEIMCISVKTVDFHCSQLMDKLDIHDRVELARFAIREGFVDA